MRVTVSRCPRWALLQELTAALCSATHTAQPAGSLSPCVSPGQVTVLTHGCHQLGQREEWGKEAWCFPVPGPWVQLAASLHLRLLCAVVPCAVPVALTGGMECS